jgi:hypothetical protein
MASVLLSSAYQDHPQREIPAATTARPSESPASHHSKEFRFFTVSDPSILVKGGDLL